MSSRSSADLRPGGAVDGETRRASRPGRRAQAGLEATDIEFERPRGVPRELLVVWALFFVVSAEVFATYARLPADELYHVSERGGAAGAGRVLVFFNFPTALVALPVILLLLDRLSGRLPQIIAAAGVALSAAVFWPGVVDQADLDAKPANALAALGVLVAVGMTIAVARRGGVEAAPRRGTAGDRLRLVVAAVAVALAVPWLLAELGFSLNGVPLLGRIWQTGELRSQPGDVVLHPAVHHGHHHGMDGVLLVMAALLLSRPIPAIRRRGLQWSAAALLSLMLAYGAAEVANDFWIEQVVKRQWTNWEIPDVTRPALSVGWAVIVVGAVAIYGLWFGRLTRRGLGARAPITAP